MYAMKAVASSMLRTMMFPHNEKIVTIDQLTHYKPTHSDNIDNILPLVHASLDVFLVINIGVITLNFTRHAYVASSHLTYYLFQAITEQALKKTISLKVYVPCTTIDHIHMPVDPL
jgi:hypothetical protein